MFATHYHLLTDEFAKHKEVTMHHMACVVEPDGYAPCDLAAAHVVLKP